MGRHSEYTDAIGERICDLVATHPIGLDKICAMYDDLPESRTINKWRNRHDDFDLKYARAKSKQAELLAEEILEISDAKHTYCDEKGNVRYDAGFTQAQRLRVDSRKWLASKLVPKVYGDLAALAQSRENVVKDEDKSKTQEYYTSIEKPY